MKMYFFVQCFDLISGCNGAAHVTCSDVNNQSRTYVYFHLFVEPIVHDQTVSQSDPMRLHWMTGNIGIIANIRVVEVGHLLPVSRPIDQRLIEGREGGHDWRSGDIANRARYAKEMLMYTEE